MQRTNDSGEEQKALSKTTRTLDKIYPKILNQVEVSQYWDIIKESVTRGMGDGFTGGEAALTNIMGAIQSGQAQCWAGLDDDNKIKCVVVTYIGKERWLNEKVLLVYSFYSRMALGDDALDAVYHAGSEYARENGCARIVALCINAASRSLARRMGFSELTFMEKAV
jgi:hypothetical protein